MKILSRIFWVAFLILIVTDSINASVLSDLASPKSGSSHRLSSYDTYGGNGDGGQGTPFKPGEMREIASIKEAGEINHIWFTLAPFDKDVLMNLILRMYWDGETQPSVEAPIGAFFGLGHGKEYSFDSLPITVSNNRGLNCFFPMPFRKGARITLENQSKTTLWAVYYYIDYISLPKASDSLYFHAQYRQQKPSLGEGNFVALDARGKGHYVGMFYYIRSSSGGWWGEGDDMIYIDGSEKPQLHGTGMEDYFGAAWGMKEGQSFLRMGSPLFEVYKTGIGNENTAYRWHLEDAIRFNTGIRVTQERGSNNERNDDFSSVAFWYQTHPHSQFPKLPTVFERLSWTDKKKQVKDQGRTTQLRSMLTDFVRRSIDPEAKHDNNFELAETYVPDSPALAVDTLSKLHSKTIPQEIWTERLKQFIDTNKLNYSIPQGNALLINCADGKPHSKYDDSAVVFYTLRSKHSDVLNFKAPDASLRGAQSGLAVRVEYLDLGEGELLVEYNAIVNGTHVALHPAKAIAIGNTGQWLTAVIPLPDAAFSGWLNCGADFRLRNKTSDIYIRDVQVIREAE